MTRLGAEPEGATPLDDDDIDGLIPDHITSRRELNEAEFENLLAALPRARRAAVRGGPDAVLSHRYLIDLHRQMFSDVWTWAGRARRRETNIGVDPALITERTKAVLDDAVFWHAHETFTPAEIAVRLHHRLVAIHPFPNGNGRCTRLIADLYLRSIGAPDLAWGGRDLESESELRRVYLDALRKADRGEYGDLLRFAEAQADSES